MGLPPGNILSLIDHRAGCREDYPSDEVEEDRLPPALRTNEAHDLSRLDRQVELGNGGPATELFGQFSHLKEHRLEPPSSPNVLTPSL